MARGSHANGGGAAVIKGEPGGVCGCYFAANLDLEIPSGNGNNGIQGSLFVEANYGRCSVVITNRADAQGVHNRPIRWAAEANIKGFVELWSSITIDCDRNGF